MCVSIDSGLTQLEVTGIFPKRLNIRDAPQLLIQQYWPAPLMVSDTSRLVIHKLLMDILKILYTIVYLVIITLVGHSFLRILNLINTGGTVLLVAL